MCPNKVEPKSVQEICCLYLKWSIFYKEKTSHSWLVTESDTATLEFGQRETFET